MTSKREELEEKERAVNVRKNSGKKLPKKVLCLEDASLKKQTGRSMKYANTKLPADPRYRF